LFTEPLRELFQWWSQFKLQAQKASVRLRVDEQGHWGVWLDMANVDVRDLLQQDALLSEWVAKAHIEIGQRHKVLRKIATAWKLADPELRSWFHTVDGNGNKFNLYGSVGSFTQVGRAVNAILVQRSLELLGPASERTILELGAGSGNFTLAFAAEGFRVKAFEQSAGALEALKKSLQEYPPLATRVECHAGNFQKVNWGEMSKEDTILFLDPPRSGVGANLLEQVRAGHFSTIVYVACGVEAWVSDGHLLKASGYQLEKLEWVDQFPNTPLYEILSAWSLKPS
jgi:23S rRNA (uracil1939-C5)-methyltransferase